MDVLKKGFEEGKGLGKLSIYKGEMPAAGEPLGEPLVTVPIEIPSINYTFPIDGDCTEACTMVANTSYWKEPAPLVTEGPNKNGDDFGEAPMFAVKEQDVKAFLAMQDSFSLHSSAAIFKGLGIPAEMINWIGNEAEAKPTPHLCHCPNENFKLDGPGCTCGGV